MRKSFFLLLLFGFLPFTAKAQTLQITAGMTATAATTGTGIAVPTTNFHQLVWYVSGPLTGCTVAVDTSPDNSSWTAGGAIGNQTCTSGGQSPLTNVIANYIRINITTLTGGGTVRVFYTGYPGGQSFLLSFNGVTGSLPATCTVGQMAFLTDATAGHNVKLCTTTNVWTEVAIANPLIGDATTGSAGRQTNNYAVLTSDFTDANAAGLQNITGLSFTLSASLAQNIPFFCHLSYSQATVVADTFGIQDVTVAPTHLDAEGWMNTSTTAQTFGNLVNLATTTATGIVTATPTVTTVNGVILSGLIQQPSNASTSVIQFMVQQATAANVIVIKAGSYCRIW